MRPVSLLIVGAAASSNLFQQLPLERRPAFQPDALRLADEVHPAARDTTYWPAAFRNQPLVVASIPDGPAYAPALDMRTPFVDHGSETQSNPAVRASVSVFAGSVVFAAALYGTIVRRPFRSTSGIAARLSVSGRPFATPPAVFRYRQNLPPNRHFLRARLLSMTATASSEVEPDAAAKDSKAKDSPAGILNRQLNALEDSEAILELVAEKEKEMNAVNLATGLHRLASVNKKQRVSREALFRDPRFASLLDAIDHHSIELTPRSVADVLWSLATLQHFPARLLKPVITSVVRALEKQAFEAQHLSTAVWALASLETRPMRLSALGDVVADNATVPKSVSDLILARIETQAIPLVSSMNQQNCANLLWGFAKLDYQPTELMPKLAARLLEPGMVANAKPVEVTDLAYALAELKAPKEDYKKLIIALADRATPGKTRNAFSSRQVVVVMSSLLRLDAIDLLRDGLLDEWIGAVRVAHEAQPMLAKDSRNLEETLTALGLDASWVKRTEMLNKWVEMAAGRGDGKGRAYTDEELLATFKAIDTDNSGDIDKAELLEAIQQINPGVDSKTVMKMLNFADGDGDQQVSFEEFKQIMLKQSKMVAA